MKINDFSNHADNLKSADNVYWALKLSWDEDPGDGSLICKTIDLIASLRNKADPIKQGLAALSSD